MKKAHRITRLLRRFIEGSEALRKSKIQANNLSLIHAIILIPKALLYYAGMLGLWIFIGLYFLVDWFSEPKKKTQKPVNDD